MIPSISTSPVSPQQVAGWNPPTVAPPANQPVDFQKLLFNSIQQTNELAHTADANVETRLLGGDITSAEVYTSLRKAELALKMMTQVRNKMVAAFQEVQQMRM